MYNRFSLNTKDGSCDETERRRARISRIESSGVVLLDVFQTFPQGEITVGTAILWGAVPCLLARWLPVVLREYTVTRGDCAF